MSPPVIGEASRAPKSGDDILEHEFDSSVYSEIFDLCCFSPYNNVLFGDDNISGMGDVCWWVNRSFIVDLPFRKCLQCPYHLQRQFISVWWISTLWQTSHLLAYYFASWKTMGHHSPNWKTFLAVPFAQTCPLTTPECNSHYTSYLSWSRTHLDNIQSRPKLCSCHVINR